MYKNEIKSLIALHTYSAALFPEESGFNSPETLIFQTFKRKH